MSQLIGTLMNAVPRLVLASPAHRLLSGRYATLHFTGRKTGRRYHVPVAYRGEQDRVVVSTDSAWWCNIADGQAFTITLRGRHLHAAASRLGQDESVVALRELVQVPRYTKAAGIARTDGEVAEADLVRAADERIVLAITLGRPM